MAGRDSLPGVARRRSEMESAMQALERTAAGPSGHANWIDDLGKEIRRLQVALNNHIAEVEPPTALLDQITDQAPACSGGWRDSTTSHRPQRLDRATSRERGCGEDCRHHAR